MLCTNYSAVSLCGLGGPRFTPSIPSRSAAHIYSEAHAGSSTPGAVKSGMQHAAATASNVAFPCWSRRSDPKTGEMLKGICYFLPN